MCTKGIELVTPRVVAAPHSAASSCVESLLMGGDCTHWTSAEEDPVDSHFVFDFVDSRAPARIEWSDWGREDGASFMKLAVSDEVHTGWSRVCGWATQQTSDWQFHDVAPGNKCSGRYWKLTIKRAHRPGFGLQLRGLRLHACATTAHANGKNLHPTQAQQAGSHDHVNARLIAGVVHSEVNDWRELVNQLRAENAELKNKIQDLQRNMTQEHAEIVGNREAHLHALQQQLQDEAKKAMREQARALQLEGEVLQLRRKLTEIQKNAIGGVDGTTCDLGFINRKLQEERDEAIRARNHLENSLSHALSGQGWYATPLEKCKLGARSMEFSALPSTQARRKSAPSLSALSGNPKELHSSMEFSPLPSTQASTQVSPEPSPPSSPRIELTHCFDGMQTHCISEQ